MKISEITASDVAGFLRLEAGEYDDVMMGAIIDAAKQYIISYTGIPETGESEDVVTIDNYPDFYIAFMVLCQDMYDNRSMYIDKSNVNRVVDCILGMHCTNLL